MKVQSINTFKPVSFKSATVSINAFSDTHGELSLANNALEEMRVRKNGVLAAKCQRIALYASKVSF